MRPLKIEIEGFTAFRQRTCLDFRDLDLFAITGPTGAGKSSLIDAVCYALYGRIPRVNTEVSVCISLGIDRMQVSLEFLANDRQYRVLREARRKGAGAVRLEQLSGDAWQPLADRAREANQMIEGILGLDFEAFIRSALLPQGQFQEFLAGSPDRRRDVLDRLLRIDVYKRMQQQAGQQAQVLLQAIRAIEQRLAGELADATPETLKRRGEELAAVIAEAAGLETRGAALQQGLGLARNLAATRQELTAQTAAQVAVEERLSAAIALAATGDQALADLEKDLFAARQQLAANAYDDQALAALTLAANLALNLEKDARAVAEAEAGIAALAQKTAAAADVATAQAKAHAQARAALDAAQAAFEEERRHDLAAALQQGLQPGAACPVCGGAVGVITSRPSRLAAAQQAFDAARAAEEKQRAAAQAAATAAAVADTNLNNARERLAQQAELVDGAASQLTAALPAMADRSLKAVQAALAEQRAARAERTSLQQREAELAGAIARREAELQTARADAARLEAEARAIDAAVAAARDKVSAAGGALQDLAVQQAWDAVLAVIDAGRDATPALERDAAAAATHRTELLTQKGRLEEQVRLLERDIEAAAGLRHELAQHKAGHDIAADLAQMLRADRFQAYLQAEALRSLAEDGSRKLLDLSSGRYELQVAAAGQDFVVIDRWNSSETRSVRSLSGGETFLASLALALSLAETLPGLAPGRRLSLDSIFLDEGFGSLDAEALDRAADALDALRNENRMVCVVTHIEELAQRLPARVVVTKTESGSSVAIA